MLRTLVVGEISPGDHSAQDVLTRHDIIACTQISQLISLAFLIGCTSFKTPRCNIREHQSHVVCEDIVMLENARRYRVAQYMSVRRTKDPTRISYFESTPAPSAPAIPFVPTRRSPTAAFSPPYSWPFDPWSSQQRLPRPKHRRRRHQSSSRFAL